MFLRACSWCTYSNGISLAYINTNFTRSHSLFLSVSRDFSCSIDRSWLPSSRALAFRVWNSSKPRMPRKIQSCEWERERERETASVFVYISPSFLLIAARPRIPCSFISPSPSLPLAALCDFVLHRSRLSKFCNFLGTYKRTYYDSSRWNEDIFLVIEFFAEHFIIEFLYIKSWILMRGLVFRRWKIVLYDRRALCIQNKTFNYRQYVWGTVKILSGINKKLLRRRALSHFAKAFMVTISENGYRIRISLWISLNAELSS